MSTMQLEVKQGVHVLSLTNHEHENMLNMDVMNEYLSVFDQVDSYKGNTALLIRCEHEKTFSTGIDLEWLMQESPEDKQAFVRAMETMLYRLALLSAPTVIALNGNTYAGGAVIALAADFRLMRADRGRLCLPEININMSFPPLMNDVINLITDKHTLKTMALTGKAYTGEECLAVNLVDSIHPEDELQQAAFEMAQNLAQKNRQVYTTIRNDLRPNISKYAEYLGLS